MVQVTVEVDTGGLMNKLSPEKITEVKRLGLEYSSQEMVRTLMMNSPVDHGLLKSWFIDSIDDTEAHIKTPAEYAVMVNDGTRPHVIEPVSAKALYWDGASHPVKRVYHPGTQGQHFVENSISDVEGRLNEYFLKALEEVLG